MKIRDRFRASRRLQVRFLVIALPLVFVSTTIFFAGLEAYSYRTAVRDLHDELHQMVASQSAALSDPLWNVEETQIVLTLKAIMTHPDVVAARVLDEHGKVFAACDLAQCRSPTMQTLTEEGARLGTAGAEPVALHAAHPIVFNDNGRERTIGRLEIAMTQARLWAAMRMRFLFGGAAAILVLLGVVASVVLAHRRTIGIPLERLLKAINLAHTRNLHEPVAWASRDEIGTVIGAFNEMQAKQAAHEEELQRARDSLEKRVEERTAELRVTFDNMGDGVAMFDPDLRLAAWNRNFQRILGLSDEFLGGRPTSAEYVRYLAVHGEYGAVDVETEVRRLTEITRTQWSSERMRPDGRVIEVRHNPVPGGGFVLIYGDITERKRADSEIRAARDAAEKALGELRATQQQLVVQQKMAALGQLTAGIAHEIKNPLNFVNNFAELSVELLDDLKIAAAPGVGTLDYDTRAEIDDTIEMLTSNLAKISEHGRRADGIVQSMLLHSRGGGGDWQTVDVNALVDEALNLAYHGARAQDQSFNITLERDLDRTLAPIEVVPQDVTRVFLNLIGNGFYAANKRRREAGDSFRPALKVTTRLLRNAVEARVRDNGTGIAPEHREKLFQPFFTTKPSGEGTGLGLSISYDIVTSQHGGVISVDSEPGEFTEFTVRLPCRRHATAPGRAA
jgi:PAS domain S-box-containing protein